MREMIEIGGIKLHLYGLFIGLGIWAASEAGFRLSKKRKIKEKTFNQLLIWVVINGVLGTRLYHVIEYWDYYQQNLSAIPKIWEGGLGIWGGFITGVLTILIFHQIKKKKEKTKLTDLLDMVTIGVPLGQAIGRWGNFFNKELYGKVTSLPWGWYIEETGKKHHPLFLYESILNLALFLILWQTSKKKKTKSGEITAMYLMGYGVIRFCLEWLRPEEIWWKVQGIPVAAILGLISFCLGLIFYLKNRNLN